MSGFQLQAHTESDPEPVIQGDEWEIVDTGVIFSRLIYDDADPPREPMGFGEKVGLVFLVIASVVVVLGGLGWLWGALT